MLQILLVAIGAGAAAALLFASAASGAGIGFILFKLAPLPILIAAIGWNHLAGLLAALLSAVTLGLALGGQSFLTFLIGVGLPAWWLGYLSMLGRAVGTNGAGTMEWYPVGHLVFWIAITATAAVALTAVGVGDLAILLGLTDLATLQAEIRGFLEQAFAARMRANPDFLDRPDVKQLIDAMMMAIFPAAALLMTIVNTFNLWLAGRIVSVSGRLNRPWPDLSAMALPGFAPGLLAAAVVGSFIAGLPGRLSGLLTASLFMAYALMGFAVLHAITRNMGSGRLAVLIVVYLIAVLFVWPILAISMLGLAESAFNIRARFAAPAAGPPTTRT
jgi:Predicted membrane protein (DUF2232)